MIAETIDLYMYLQDYDETFVMGVYSTPDLAKNKFWERLLLPYIKSEPLFVSPQLWWNAPEQTNWYDDYNDAINLSGTAPNRITKQSYAMPAWEFNVGVGPNWADAQGSLTCNHAGAGSGPGCGAQTLAMAALPADTVLLCNAVRPVLGWIGEYGTIGDDGKLIGSWSDTGKEFLTIVYPQDADSTKQGWFTGNNNYAFCDGHAKSRRWGTTCPNEYTLQDDKAEDPLMRCR